MIPAGAGLPACVALRRVEVKSVPRDCARIPAVRVDVGWQVLVEGRWYTVVGEPVLLGDGEDPDGGRVRLMVTGPGMAVLDMAVLRRGERIWVRCPRPGGSAAIVCQEPGGCGAPGPFTATDDGLRCISHLADYLLSDTYRGPDADPERGCDHG